MIRVLSSRIVKIADQCLSAMRPISIRRGSPCMRAGSWRRSGSSHNTWPSTKSMPCFALFASLFSGSNSNFMVLLLYRPYTACQPIRCLFPLVRTLELRRAFYRVASLFCRIPSRVRHYFHAFNVSMVSKALISPTRPVASAGSAKLSIRISSR